MSHRRLERIYTQQLPECQATSCSEQARYLKFKWLQQKSNPQSLLNDNLVPKLAKWLNGWVSLYELSDCGLESPVAIT